MKDPPSGLGIVMIIAGFVATAVACAMLPRDYMVLLPLSNLPLIIVAKVPQARELRVAMNPEGLSDNRLPLYFLSAARGCSCSVEISPCWAESFGTAKRV